MYEAEPDPYCYPTTTVLKNKANIRVEAELEDYETALSFARSQEPLPNGRLSVSHYRAIHRHLFGDVYTWAGTYRTVRLSKGGSVFCYPEYISRELRQLFAWLKGERYLTGLTRQQFAAHGAHFLAQLNAIHPFREGNGRTQPTFFSLLADKAAFSTDFDRLDSDSFLNAMIRAFNGDERPLVECVEHLIS